MNVAEYAARDATALADLIRGGEVTAAEVRAAGTAALRIAGPRLNALAADPFPALACDANGPFAGVPFALKDLRPEAAGVPSGLGSLITGPGLVSDHDSHVMTRFRDAGLAVVALATSDELGFGANTMTPRHGRTLNPWDPAKSIGGSSGGSAALVAAGALPMAQASDAGGSIRIPASVAGLVGLKPTRGRVPAGPDVAEGHWGLATDFVVTRTVRDTARALDALSGPMPGDRFRIPEPTRPWAMDVADRTPGLRVAYTTAPWAGTPVAPDMNEATEAAAAALARAGHRVERASPAFDWPPFLRAIQILGCASSAIGVARLETATGRSASRDTLQPIILSYAEIGRTLSVHDIGDALSAMNTVSRRVSAFFQDWDVLVTPAMAVVNWRPEDFNPTNPVVDANTWMQRMFSDFCFSPLFNVTGGPAMSLPTGWTASGFPVGVQVAADLGGEDKLLRAAGYLEDALPWASRRPRLHVVNVGKG